MSDLPSMVMRVIETDPTIDSTDVVIEVKTTGFLKKRKIIYLTGSVKSETEKKKATQVVAHFAGDNYDVVNDLTVKS
jgi:osmotically-inducible protein OsmY